MIIEHHSEASYCGFLLCFKLLVPLHCVLGSDFMVDFYFLFWQHLFFLHYFTADRNRARLWPVFRRPVDCLGNHHESLLCIVEHF